MELLVFGASGTRVLVFPTRSGRYFDYENFGMLEGARERVEAGYLQLWCVDSVDHESFYCSEKPPRDRMKRHEQYERYLIDEVIPQSAERNPKSALIAHGCSLGAYHAVNLALRHPRLFVKVVALSGRYDLTFPTGPFPDLLDGWFDESVYFHMPAQYVPNLCEGEILSAIRQLHMIFAVGKDDPFLGSNSHLVEYLQRYNTNAELHLWEGRAHRGHDWRDMIRLYL
jgi:esterase/lipase superfamily enzyme